jgi:hypothetical protein
MNRALLIIAKRPIPGQTKTRLSPPFSHRQAAELFKCFLLDMLNIARQVPYVTRFINYWPITDAAYFRQLAPDFDLIPQTGDALGERLDNVLTHCLSRGFDQAVITNSDSPTLPSQYLRQAFNTLDKNDVVFGPCDDGGYYLIGLTRPQPRLLREVKMSTGTVLQDTLALAKKENLRTALLPYWYDVDTATELNRLATDLQTAGHQTAPCTRRFLQNLIPEKFAS